MEVEEPLLKPNPKRFVLFPIERPRIWDLYEKALACFWTPGEIDFAGDVLDWSQKLNDNERLFISHVLAFFAASDGIVNENLAVHMLRLIQSPEARCFYGLQIAIENIHSTTYSLMIDTFIRFADEKRKLFDAIETMPVVAKKAKWALAWIDNENATFAQRLVAFAVVEGIFFSGSFCAIYWLKKRNLMPGLCFSNELISRDEGLHCDFACLLYGELWPENRLTQSKVFSIILPAVEIEKEFVSQALSVSLLGMNATLMCEYIEVCANKLCTALGCEKLFPNAKNPFPWMELISLNGKTNFFEKRVSEYAKANARSTLTQSDSAVGVRTFTTDADF